MCSLRTIKYGSYGQRAVLEDLFMFATPQTTASPSTKEDYIEVRVHRISQRRRLRNLPIDPDMPKPLQESSGAVKLSAGGLIERGRPARKYQYLLVDAQDEPYATFRFYCRSQDYLRQHLILQTGNTLSSTSVSSTEGSYFDVSSSPSRYLDQFTPSPLQIKKRPTEANTLKQPSVELVTPTKSPAKSPRRWQSSSSIVTSPPKDSFDLPAKAPRSPDAKSMGSPPSNLNTITSTTSLENLLLPLPSFRPLSPTIESSPLLPDSLQIRGYKRNESPVRPQDDEPPSPDIAAAVQSRFVGEPKHVDTRSALPPHLTFKRHRPSKLKLTFDGTTTIEELEAKRQVSDPIQQPRPLSPFTSSGFLRRLVSNPFDSRKVDK